MRRTVVVATVSVRIGQRRYRKARSYDRLTVVAASGKDQTSSPSPTVPTFSLTEVVVAPLFEGYNILIVCVLVFLVCVRVVLRKRGLDPFIRY